MRFIGVRKGVWIKKHRKNKALPLWRAKIHCVFRGLSHLRALHSPLGDPQCEQQSRVIREPLGGQVVVVPDPFDPANQGLRDVGMVDAVGAWIGVPNAPEGCAA